MKRGDKKHRLGISKNASEKACRFFSFGVEYLPMSNLKNAPNAGSGVVRNVNLFLIAIFFLSGLTGCSGKKAEDDTDLFARRHVKDSAHVVITSAWMDSLPRELLYKVAARPASGFDLPVGPPDGKDYYRARGVIKGEHYGEDWNHESGGNSDFGHLVYAIADGYVSKADTVIKPGWGMVIRILHNYGTDLEPLYVESLYAHLASMWLKPGNFIRRGQPIGTIGTAEGIYHAHLHFELRKEPGMPTDLKDGGDSTKYLDPTVFIEGHRPAGHRAPANPFSTHDDPQDSVK